MTVGGHVPPPPPGWVLVGEGTPPPPRPRRKRWLALVSASVVAVLVAGGVAAGYVVLTGDDDSPYPDAWDPAVLPYVRIVERERGLQFEHPVYVAFLSQKAFRDQVTADEEDLTEDEREEIEQFTGLFRALGMIEGEVDLFAATNDLSGAGVLGYYSYDDKRIRVRGADLTLEVRATLVHELTHALQDQHFDLAGRQERFDELEDSSASYAFDALIEGDASRIEAEYEARLSAKQRAALASQRAATAEQFEGDSAAVPEILKTTVAAPYVLGEALLALSVELAGNDAVDDLFADPPSNDEHLLDPWTHLVDDQLASRVEAPALLPGEEEFDSGEFGPLAWYLFLSERVPVAEALEAVDGWGGDAYVAFEREGQACVRILYRGDTQRDGLELRDASRKWIAGLPGAPAKVSITTSGLEFESCDPGIGTAVGSGSSDDALQLAVARTYAAVQILKAGASESVARCFTTELVRELTFEQIIDPNLAQNDAVAAKVQELVEGCG